MEPENSSAVTLIEKYFAGIPDFTNHFYPPARKDDIRLAEQMLEVSLPADYKNFLLYADGFEGFVGDNYLRLIPVGYLHEDTREYCSESRPWAVYLGTNAGGEMIVLDTRSEPFQFGMLPYLGDNEDFIPLGDTFEKFIVRYYNDDVFE
jgi:SMI1/KNR4 family protein SUKH-1